MFNLWLDYPTAEEEMRIVKTTTSSDAPELARVLGAGEIIGFQDLVRRVPVADGVVQYAVDLVARTRPNTPASPQFINQWLRWGAGPRASQYLVLGAKARALLDGRHTPDRDDIRAMAGPVLRHRIVTNFTAEAEDVTSIQIIEKLLELNA